MKVTMKLKVNNALSSDFRYQISLNGWQESKVQWCFEETIKRLDCRLILNNLELERRFDNTGKEKCILGSVEFSRPDYSNCKRY